MNRVPEIFLGIIAAWIVALAIYRTWKHFHVTEVIEEIIDYGPDWIE